MSVSSGISKELSRLWMCPVIGEKWCVVVGRFVSYIYVVDWFNKLGFGVGVTRLWGVELSLFSLERSFGCWWSVSSWVSLCGLAEGSGCGFE